MTPQFLDTNPLLRYLTRDDEAKARQALALLLRVERGEEHVITSSLVIFETVFTLQSFYRMPRAEICEQVGAIIRMRGLQLAHKRIYEGALDVYADHPFLSFADAFNVAFMRDRGLTEIYSWDEDFDRLPGISRVEPVVSSEAG